MLKFIRVAMLALAFIPAVAMASSSVYTEIDANKLLEMQKSVPDLVVIDSRGGEWFDDRVIEGALNLSAADTNEENLAKIIPSKDTPIVFYCSSLECPASKAAAHEASNAGYNNIYKYPGGLKDWEEKNLPIVSYSH